jgi:hypothetical protein
LCRDSHKPRAILPIEHSEEEEPQGGVAMHSHEATHSNMPYDISAVTSKVAWAEMLELVIWCGSLLAVFVVAALAVQ